MEIIHYNYDKDGYFKAVENDAQAGLMTYVWAGEGKFIINHTEVNPHFSGQGVGNQMVMAAVDFARANHKKILPLCPFAKSVFAKIVEIRDVL